MCCDEECQPVIERTPSKGRGVVAGLSLASHATCDPVYTFRMYTILRVIELLFAAC